MKVDGCSEVCFFKDQITTCRATENPLFKQNACSPCVPSTSPAPTFTGAQCMRKSTWHARWLGKMRLKTNTSESVLGNRRSIPNCRDLERKLVHNEIWPTRKALWTVVVIGQP